MFGLFSGKKSHQVQINSGDAVIEMAADDNLLNAALNSGLNWPYNCRVGSCGTCRCRLVRGKIKSLNDFSYVLDGDELDAGLILACQTQARSDLEIEVNLGASVALASAESVAGEIIQSVSLTHDILAITIRLERSLPAYLAGQYAEVKANGIDAPRSYSFACAPSCEAPLQATFFVRLVPGGEMSTWLHQQSRVGEPVSIKGPFGSFYLRSSMAPILCIAGGSGLAPIKALLEQLGEDGFIRPVKFLFGARSQKDLYCQSEMEGVQKAAGNGMFEFIPILSDEEPESDWSGLRGMVTEHINGLDGQLSESQAYLCGPPPMINSAIEVLNAKGMKNDQIFFDKFLDASHLPGGKREQSGLE